MTIRNALITGASRGIGRACALALAEAGHRVVLAARNGQLLEEAAGEIREKTSVDVSTIELDISSRDSIKQGFAKAKEFGPITILVNNAGVTHDALSMRMSATDWDNVIQTNLSGAFFCAQQVMPVMMKERWGRIINIASVVGQIGNPGQANYVAAKAGLIGLTKTLAHELASRNITANCVAPGFIETDMTASLAPELREKMLNMIPVKRFGKAEDIAAAVRFLASEEAEYITGAVINVNGGMYM